MPDGDDAIVVLGGDALGFALAADLALGGRRVVLYETTAREALIAPIRERRQITVHGSGGTKVATLSLVTDEPFAALAAGNVLLATVPAHAQAMFGEFLLPLVEPRHLLVLCRGGLGSLALAHWLLLRGRQPSNLATFVETDLEPFVCRKMGADSVVVHGAPSRLGLGVFPAARTVGALGRLAEVLRGAWAYPHAAAAGLGAVGVLLHAATVVMNAGRCERPAGEFLLYDDGLTPGVAAVVEALDAERRRLSAALGYAQTPIAQALAAADLGPGGDLWATVHGSRALSEVRAPSGPRAPWLTGGIPFVLRTWAELGRQLDVPVDTIRAVIRLADAAAGFDSWSGGRSLADLGVEGLTRVSLDRYLRVGSVD